MKKVLFLLLVIPGVIVGVYLLKSEETESNYEIQSKEGVIYQDTYHQIFSFRDCRFCRLDDFKL